MKSRIIPSIAGVALATAFIVGVMRQESSPSLPPGPAVTHKERSARVAAPSLPEPAEEKPEERILSRIQFAPAGEEAANLELWRKHFNALVAEKGDATAAVETLRNDVDVMLSEWVDAQIELLAGLSPEERLDQLEIVRNAVQEGAATILGSLGLPGSQHVANAFNALDKVRAEIEYAEVAPDSSSRLALLHIDRERQSRLDEVVGIEDEEARSQAETELEDWYQHSVAKVFPDEQFAME